MLSSDSPESFVMDSGATISIVKELSLFVPGSLTDTSINYTISGVTSNKLVTSFKGRLIHDLGEALYCPGIPANLLSVSSVS